MSVSEPTPRRGSARRASALLALALPLTACQSVHRSEASDPLPPPPVWIAHRGDSADAPENTVTAVRAALQRTPPPHFVEVDVHASRDGALVVVHDDDLERTTGQPGSVSASTWPELQDRRAGFAERFGDRFADEPLPRLADVLDAATEYDARIMIEVKPRGVGEAVGVLLRERDEIERHLVASFEPSVLLGAGLTAPGVRTMYLVSQPGPADVALAARIGATVLGCNQEHATAALAEQAHAAGLQLWTYTVNDAARAAELRVLGVDGIISDRFADVRAGVLGHPDE